MFGVQVGMFSQFLMQPKCWIDFEMKGGIFTNRAIARTHLHVSTAVAVRAAVFVGVGRA